MTTPTTRQGIFLSHATPDDNAFTLWLGGKLAALGYDVWADIFRLKGGDDWERILEDAIRNKAAKVLIAANPVSVDRQGVRNEIKLAVETGRKIEDPAFIIPLRMEDYESPYLVAHAQWVDFKKSWFAGLKDLISTLEESGVQRPGATERTAFWQELQLGQSRALTAEPEILNSNWLEVRSLPAELVVYDFAAGIFIGAKDAAIKTCPLPLVPFGRGLISFAPHGQLQEHFGDALPLKPTAILNTQDYAANGSDKLRVSSFDARRHLVDLMRRGIERYLDTKGLKQTDLATERRMWWADKALGGLDRKVFGWPDGPSGRRQLLGQSKARNVYWHYGVSCWPGTSPLHHVRLSGHVIFTIDGHNPVGDARRMHMMRRTLCRSWRNDRWRDLMLTFVHWLGDGQNELRIGMGDGAEMVLSLPPLSFKAGFGLGPPPALSAKGDGDEDTTAEGVDDEDDPLSESSDPYDEEDGEDAAADEEPT